MSFIKDSCTGYSTLSEIEADRCQFIAASGKKIPSGNAALVIAHPGHELRMYGWLEAVHPMTFVLTDGSGHTGHSRLASTSKVLQDTPVGNIYGRLTDAELYEAVLDLDHRLFIGLAKELSGAFVGTQIDYVVGDRAEGYNPGHDVCRLLISTAVKAAHKTHHREIANFDFTLVGQPDERNIKGHEQNIHLMLSSAALSRKIEAALNYQEMADEVNSALGSYGQEAFAIESLSQVIHPAANDHYFSLLNDERPFYEIHGERQVAAGFYQRVLRFREHILPLAEALNDWVSNLSPVSNSQHHYSL